MPTKPLSDQDRAAIRSLAKEWGKIVARRAFGPDGPGLDVDFAQMEEVALEACRGLNEGTLEQLLQQQADQLGAEQPCPHCGRLCPVQSEPRPLVACGGVVEHAEPRCHCPTCRRDFFPSASRAAVG